MRACVRACVRACARVCVCVWCVTTCRLHLRLGMSCKSKRWVLCSAPRCGGSAARPARRASRPVGWLTSSSCSLGSSAGAHMHTAGASRMMLEGAAGCACRESCQPCMHACTCVCCTARLSWCGASLEVFLWASSECLGRLTKTPRTRHCTTSDELLACMQSSWLGSGDAPGHLQARELLQVLADGSSRKLVLVQQPRRWEWKTTNSWSFSCTEGLHAGWEPS